MGVGVVLGDGMGAFVGAFVGVAEWAFVFLDINVIPDVLWMQVINKLRLKVVDGYRYKHECECWV